MRVFVIDVLANQTSETIIILGEEHAGHFAFRTAVDVIPRAFRTRLSLKPLQPVVRDRVLLPDLLLIPTRACLDSFL